MRNFDVEALLSIIMQSSQNFDLQLATFIRDIITETSSKLFEIEGGMDQLTNQFADRKVAVRLCGQVIQRLKAVCQLI